MAALGVTDIRFLGGAGPLPRLRDDGDRRPTSNPRAFWNADLDEAVAHAVAVVREVRPQVVVTYDENGGYGHPDHIQAHRVAMGAVDGRRRPGLPARPRASPGTVARSTGTACPRSVLQQGIDALGAVGEESFFEGVDERRRPARSPCRTRRSPRRSTAAPSPAHKDAAMRAHPTQIMVDGPFFALSNNLGQEVLGTEYYRLVRGERGPAGRRPNGWEDDLFAGLPG